MVSLVLANLSCGLESEGIVDTLVGHFSLISFTQLYDHAAYELHNRRGNKSRLTLDLSFLVMYVLRLLASYLLPTRRRTPPSFSSSLGSESAHPPNSQRVQRLQLLSSDNGSLPTHHHLFRRLRVIQPIIATKRQTRMRLKHHTLTSPPKLLLA